MSGIDNPLPSIAHGERKGSCVDVQHEYCSARTRICNECLCQRWIRVDYIGNMTLDRDTWEQFFAVKLKEFKCEYFGYERVDHVNGGPGWIFFIYLHNHLSRAEIAGCFDPADFLVDTQIPKYSACCYSQFMRLMFPFSNEDAYSFASNEAWLKTVLKNEIDSCYSYGIYCRIDLLSPALRRSVLL